MARCCWTARVAVGAAIPRLRGRWNHFNHWEKFMKRIPIAGFVAGILSLAAAPHTLAVTDGSFDGNAHPHVGLLIFDIGGSPAWRCSGTLLSPTVLLTAGHCTSGATGGRVWFEADVQSNQVALGYPFGGPTSVEFCGIASHPEYNDNLFFLHDVGVVTLCQPVQRSVYGVLPQANQLDALKTARGTKDVTFTAVGYGMQKSFPSAAAFHDVAQKVRMLATPKLNQINTGYTGNFSLLLSNNANTGGTCFGDSGGPNFLGNGNVVAGVTSFGINGNCAGTGGVFRMDRQNVLDFVNAFLD
jgi:Trypsin